MIDISQICEKLEFKEGIWTSLYKTDISYPDFGNEFCFSVEENSFWFKHRNNCIIELIKKYSSGNIIFDIGGGNGVVSAMLEENGLRTVLIEPDISGVYNAQKRGLKNIINASFHESGFKNESIAEAGLFDVLEHIKDDEGFLASVRDTLKRKGILYLTIPAYRFLWSEEDIISGHFRRYNRKTISSLLKTTGYRIEYLSFFFSFFPVPAFIVKTIPFKLGLVNPGEVVKNSKFYHSKKSKWFNSFLNLLFYFEKISIRKGRYIPFGLSLLVCATKA